MLHECTQVNLRSSRVQFKCIRKPEQVMMKGQSSTVEQGVRSHFVTTDYFPVQNTCRYTVPFKSTEHLDPTAGIGSGKH